MNVVNMKELKGTEKAAILLVALGKENSGRVLQNLNEQEIEALTTAIASVDNVPSRVINSVLEEFHHMTLAREYISQGGLDYARDILEKAMENDKADEIIERVITAMEVTGFEALREVDTSQLMNFIQNEHPQTVALILSYLHPEQAGAILSELPPDEQRDVIHRIATMEKVSPELIKEIEVALKEQFEGLGQVRQAGGTKTAAEILNMTDRATERSVLSDLGEKYPEIVSEVKHLMFTFEDILTLDAKDVQKVLQEVDMKIVALALKAANEDLRKFLFANVSQRVAENIQEEMDYLGGVRLGDAENAQRSIIETIRTLDAQGLIVLSNRGGREDQIVE